MGEKDVVGDAIQLFFELFKHNYEASVGGLSGCCERKEKLYSNLLHKKPVKINSTKP
jgi:hypothetical protein